MNEFQGDSDDMIERLSSPSLSGWQELNHRALPRLSSTISPTLYPSSVKCIGRGRAGFVPFPLADALGLVDAKLSG